jgi:hypothetical protein
MSGSVTRFGVMAGWAAGGTLVMSTHDPSNGPPRAGGNEPVIELQTALRLCRQLQDEVRGQWWRLVAVRRLPPVQRRRRREDVHRRRTGALGVRADRSALRR